MTAGPRAHITYAVDTGEGVLERELPFVIGVLADLGRQREIPPRALAERSFFQIDRDNLDVFLAAHEAPERARRSLEYLAAQTEISRTIKIRVLNASKEELLADLRSPRGALFRKLHDDEFGFLGGEPYGVVIGDYEFAHDADDLELLERISRLAASIHAPFLAGASPRMFGCDEFAALTGAAPADLENLLEGPEYSRWRSFRKSEAARYACLLLPRILLHRTGGGDCVWGNAAYALATRLAESFRVHGWCTAICGPESGGLVEGLARKPVNTTFTAARARSMDAWLIEFQERPLTRAGFNCLMGIDAPVFFSAPTCYQPDDPESAFAERIQAQLPYVMAVSRFAHYLKVILHEARAMNSFASLEQCEQFLKEWIADYVLPENTGEETDQLARYPLREARLEVAGHPEKRGSYAVTAFLRPHFLLPDPGRPMRIEIRENP